jgi:hypothetical protein
MSSADIDAAVKKALDEEAYIPTAGSNANTYSMVRRRHSEIRCAAGNHDRLSVDTIQAPISKLIAYLDHRIQEPEQWETLCSDLCNRIQQPFTAWFKTADIEKSQELIYAFCRCLIELNPYLIFILVLESEKACALDTINTLKQNIYVKEVIYQTITAQKAMALLYVLPWNSGTLKADLPSCGFQECDLIWSLRIHNHQPDWKNELRAAIDEPCSTGVLIDVDDNVSLSERALILQYLYPVYQRTTKMIHFTNLELDTFLTHFNKFPEKYQIITPWHLESILTLDRNFSIQSLYEPDQHTYQDLAAYQLFMQRAMQSKHFNKTASRTAQ